MALTGKIELEFVGTNHNNVSGESNKFWSGWTHGTNFVAHWGKIGTDGQIRSWKCSTPSAAHAKLQDKVDEKCRKGYRVCGQWAKNNMIN